MLVLLAGSTLARDGWPASGSTGEIVSTCCGLEELAIGVGRVCGAGKHVGNQIEHGMDFAGVRVDLGEVTNSLTRLNLHSSNPTPGLRLIFTPPTSGCKVDKFVSCPGSTEGSVSPIRLTAQQHRRTRGCRLSQLVRCQGAPSWWRGEGDTPRKLSCLCRTRIAVRLPTRRSHT